MMIIGMMIRITVIKLVVKPKGGTELALATFIEMNVVIFLHFV